MVSCMLDCICTPQEVLFIAEALLPLDQGPQSEDTLFTEQRGLVVIAKVVEHLVRDSLTKHRACMTALLPCLAM